MTDNLNLSSDEKRYFIAEISDTDKLMIEVPRETYRDWHRERMRRVRNGKDMENTVFVRLDEIDHEEGSTMHELVLAYNYFDSITKDESMLRDLREELEEWHSWAPLMLNMYLEGEEEEVVEVFMQRFDVSERRARACRQEFEEYVRKYISDRMIW